MSSYFLREVVKAIHMSLGAGIWKLDKHIGSKLTTHPPPL